MTLVRDILKAGIRPARTPRPTEFQYTQGYAHRRTSGSTGILTWKIPTAMLKTIFAEHGIGHSVVWPWVADDDTMRKRQVSRAHYYMNYHGFKIRTRCKSNGLEITCTGFTKGGSGKKRDELRSVRRVLEVKGKHLRTKR